LPDRTGLIAPVTSIARNSYIFNGRQIMLDSVIATFQPKETIIFSEIRHAVVSGKILSLNRLFADDTYPAAILLGDCFDIVPDSVIASHFSSYFPSLSVVHSSTKSFHLLHFQSQATRNAAVDANECCFIAGCIFSLRKYPSIAAIPCRRSAVSHFIST
jgi:hypothetical protein